MLVLAVASVAVLSITCFLNPSGESYRLQDVAECVEASPSDKVVSQAASVSNHVALNAQGALCA